MERTTETHRDVLHQLQALKKLSEAWSPNHLLEKEKDDEGHSDEMSGENQNNPKNRIFEHQRTDVLISIDT